MKTKLVYVLTCAPDKYYIEQALISTYSARHWNPDAYIVLIVDDLTDQLIVGKRAEILNYISEKIVVPFDDASLSMKYRSRFIKTSVRNLVKGRIMFIDCDTIVKEKLDSLDEIQTIVSAVPDALIPVEEYSESMIAPINERAKIVGYDLTKEKYHFNGGIILAEEDKRAYELFDLWHNYWKSFTQKNLMVDQPSLARANIEMNHLIQPMDVKYNCIVYTQNSFTRQAKILHISVFRNPSYIFTNKVLEFVKNNGLKNQWLIDSILNPCVTFLPFDNDVLHSNRKQRRGWIKEITRFSRGYGETIDASFADFPMHSRFRSIVVGLMRVKCNGLAAKMWMLWKRIYVWRHRKTIKDNVCRK